MSRREKRALKNFGKSIVQQEHDAQHGFERVKPLRPRSFSRNLDEQCGGGIRKIRKEHAE